MMLAVTNATKTTSRSLLVRFLTGMYFWRNCVTLTLTLTNATPNRPPRAPRSANRGTSQKYHQNTRL